MELVETMPTISMKNLEIPIIMPFVKLAISGALSFACEAWSFEITTILAGLLGTISLDAHIITLSIATFIYLSFPFAVGLATSLRVGQLIGEGRSGDAKRSSIVAYTINVIIQLVLIAVLFPCSKMLGDLFSNDDEVSELVAKLVPISCIFMLGDAIQANTGGVMRGLGKQSLVLYLNIVGFWVLAIPIGSLMTFATDMGVIGVWWGFGVGIYSAAAIGIYILKRINWGDEGNNAKLRISSPSN
jgi:MATE family multidrug resistance protein